MCRSITSSLGFKRNQITNNLPGTKNLEKVENQEPKVHQEFLEFVKQEPYQKPTTKPGSSGLNSWFNLDLLGCTNIKIMRLEDELELVRLSMEELRVDIQDDEVPGKEHETEKEIPVI